MMFFFPLRVVKLNQLSIGFWPMVISWQWRIIVVRLGKPVVVMKERLMPQVKVRRQVVRLQRVDETTGVQVHLMALAGLESFITTH